MALKNPAECLWDLSYNQYSESLLCIGAKNTIQTFNVEEATACYQANKDIELKLFDPPSTVVSSAFATCGVWSQQQHSKFFVGFSDGTLAFYN